MLSVTRGINIAMGGKRQTMPFISQRYRILTDVDKEQTKIFPYDVPFFTSREVKELVDLSKQYSFSEFVAFKLQRYAGFPPHVLKSLMPLEGLRFFYDELDYELHQRLSPADYTQWDTLIFQYCADFSKLKTPLWTWKRARAHLQKDNPLLRRASASDYLWSIWVDFEQKGQYLTESKLFQYAECYQLGQNLTPPMWIQHRSRVTGILPETLWEQTLKEQGHDIQELRRIHIHLIKNLPPLPQQKDKNVFHNKT